MKREGRELSKSRQSHHGQQCPGRGGEEKWDQTLSTALMRANVSQHLNLGCPALLNQQGFYFEPPGAILLRLPANEARQSALL